jgi:sugar phosphate isomerase/epimerase
MLPFGNLAPDGTPIERAPVSLWRSHLRQVRDLGFDYIDPTDGWVSLGTLSDARIGEFKAVLDEEGLAVSSISMTRNSVVEVERGDENLEMAHRLLDVAPTLGATIVSIGFMQALTAEQRKAHWFWLVDGHQDSPELRPLAVERVRELAEHANRNEIEISLEIYEDTFVGTPEKAVQFLEDVHHPAVGLNPDLANLVRLHRPVPPYDEMFEVVLPFANFWHMKNYTRDEDHVTGSYHSAPMPLKYGLIDYRAVIRRALELGYSGPMCCEHYGGDSLGVSAENRDYIRQVLRSLLRRAQ